MKESHPSTGLCAALSASARGAACAQSSVSCGRITAVNPTQAEVRKANACVHLFRICAFASEGQADFHCVTIPHGVEIEGAEAFDPLRRRALYDVGYDLARKGPFWATRPPGLQAPVP